MIWHHLSVCSHHCGLEYIDICHDLNLWQHFKSKSGLMCFFSPCLSVAVFCSGEGGCCRANSVRAESRTYRYVSLQDRGLLPTTIPASHWQRHTHSCLGWDPHTWHWDALLHVYTQSSRLTHLLPSFISFYHRKLWLSCAGGSQTDCTPRWWRRGWGGQRGDGNI